jgi:hypothetical protein
MLKAEALPEHAAGVVTRCRLEYRKPVDLFEYVVGSWLLTLGTKMSRAQVALCPIGLKLARLARDPAGSCLANAPGGGR